MNVEELDEFGYIHHALLTVTTAPTQFRESVFFSLHNICEPFDIATLNHRWDLQPTYHSKPLCWEEASGDFAKITFEIGDLVRRWVGVRSRIIDYA